MSSQRPDELPEADTQAARRSRWRRFSPSMGWRAFWSEIVIVVLGVVIALAANEAVEQLNWRSKVRDADARLAVDVESLFFYSAEQFATQPCINAQLDALAHRVLASGATLTPAPVIVESNYPTRPSFVIRMPTKPWQFAVWEALVANGTATHFSAAWQDRYNGIAGNAAMARSMRIEANQIIGRLRALSYPMPLDAGARRDFLVDIEGLRRHSTSTMVTGGNLIRSITGAGIAPRAEAVDDYLADSGTVQFCKQQHLPIAEWRDYKGQR